MGKSDEKETKKRAHKATTGESKHKASDGESKHKKKPSFDHTLGSTPFETTFEDNDEEILRQSTWCDNFRQLSEYKVQFGDCLVPTKYSANPTLGNWVSAQRNLYRKKTEGESTFMTAEHIRALDCIGFEWVAGKYGSASFWSWRFRELCEFKAQFGHCLVAYNYAANPKLGRWVSTQRARYREYQKGKPSCITKERIRELDRVGFEWEPNVWNARLEQLREFKVQFGDYLVPIKYSANPELGPWVSIQRSNYRLYHEGKPSSMTAEQIRELESVGFEWEPNRSNWNQRILQLREFKVQFGHSIVPNNYSADPKLGPWASDQRCQYRKYQDGKPSRITEEQIRELESVGFEWEKLNLTWNDRFLQLLEFKVQFGHCVVPLKYSANPKLGNWASNQRSQYRKYQDGKPSRITEEHIRELDNVGFEWGLSRTDSASAIWGERFREVCEFKAQFGHYLVAQNDSANLKLGKWIVTQRSNYRLYQEGKPTSMTAERIGELESVGFEWEQSNVTWNDRFLQLLEFKVQFGHCVVPLKYSANPKLGNWASNQRSQYRKYQDGKPSRITEEHIRELDNVGFEWGLSRTDSASAIWGERFREVCEFKAQFGHYLVAQNDSANLKLGKWIVTQRSNYRLYQEGKPTSMTAERIGELEGVEFEWESNCLIWSELFEQLREFKAQFGHCVVTQKHSANPKLGNWVSTQRSQYRKYQDGKPSRITELQIRELESIGFEWGPKYLTWDDRFLQLREFKVQFGHCVVPLKSTLWNWTSVQRSRYKRYQDGKPSLMTEEHIRELESVGFEWEPNRSNWKQRILQMREFKVQFGHSVVPFKYSANPELGKWVSNQRNYYRLYHEGKPSPMKEEQIRELESVGFDWAPYRSNWNQRILQLREFKVQFGHSIVPAKYSANPTLGNWVSNQRIYYRKYQDGKPSPMTEEQIRELESVGFEWEKTNLTWNDQFLQLLKFKVQFGHCVVPLKYSANLKLGKWVSHQRLQYRKYQDGKPSRITEEYIRRLGNVGFEWERNRR